MSKNREHSVEREARIVLLLTVEMETNKDTMGELIVRSPALFIRFLAFYGSFILMETEYSQIPKTKHSSESTSLLRCQYFHRKLESCDKIGSFKSSEHMTCSLEENKIHLRLVRSSVKTVLAVLPF